MVVEGFSSLSTLLPKAKQRVAIDTLVFWLHYSLTTALLLFFCIFVTTTKLIGNPIACAFPEREILKFEVVNTYCWIHSTFTLPEYDHDGTAMPQPGRGGDEVYHAYYQWIPLVLFFQAFVFYVPHWLWKSWEGGKVAAVTLDLNSVVMDKRERKDKTRLLAEYLRSSLHHHRFYAIKFLFCDVLNVIITIANICLMNKFLGGKFISYGTKVLFSLTNNDENMDPMSILFPRVTKCTFKSMGISGETISHHILCMLPYNIIYKMMYLFLWMWFWILLVCGAVEIVWRCLVFFVPAVRRWLLHKYVEGGLHKEVETLTENLHFGDFFLLYLLHRNLGNVVHSAFSELIEELSDNMIASKKGVGTP